MSAAQTVRANDSLFAAKLDGKSKAKQIVNGASFQNQSLYKSKNQNELNGMRTDLNGIKNGSKSLEEQFKAACDAIQNLPKNGPFQPSNEMLLKFYAFYKQATFGACKSSRPAIYKVVERAKYDAWFSIKHLTKEEAMQGYIDEIKKIVETMPHNEFVQKLIDAIGPFYEYVNDDNELLDQKNLNNHDQDNEEDDDDDDDSEDDDDDDNENDKNSVVENQNFVLKKNLDLNSSLTTSYDTIDKTMLNSYDENSKQLRNLNKPISNNHKQYNGDILNGLNDFTKLNGDHGKPILNGDALHLNGKLESDFMMEIKDKNEKILVDLNQLKRRNEAILINDSVTAKLENGYNNSSFHSKLNGNGIYFNQNGSLNSNEITSDDEEDFCDTSDYINEQEILIQKIKKNFSNQNGEINPDLNSYQSRDYNHNHVLNKIDQNYPNRNDVLINNINLNNDREVKNILKNNSDFTNTNKPNNNQENFSSIMHKFGGELNSPPSSLPQSGYNTQSRQSRPGSSQSMTYNFARSNLNTGHGHSHGHGSGSGGGGSSGNENFITQDTNRQILLILLRLQQDTNNVLTRLSYLESSVLSLQSNLQMNRLENSIQLNNQGASAFSVVNSPHSRSSSNQISPFSFLYDLFWNIDWKTVIIAITWPIVIRLVFYFLKKIKLLIKLRRIRN